MIESIETYKKRARAKYFTLGYLTKLIELNSPLIKSYRQTYNCSAFITQTDNKLTARYCNQRWCTVCNRIRIAKFVEGYSSELHNMDNPYFITLTVPNCTKSNLKRTLEKMDSDFLKLNDRLKKRGIKLKGIRKTECTYNHNTDTYHPHYHLIVEDFPELFSQSSNDLYYVKLNAIVSELRKDKNFRQKSKNFLLNIAKLRNNLIVNLWIGYNSDASVVAQDTKPCDDNTEIEIFKYFTKVITKVGPNYRFFPAEFDHIFRTIKGKRTFRTYGLTKQISEDIEELQAIEVENLDRKFAVYQFEGFDWYDQRTGESLTNYEPSKTLVDLINNL